MWPARTSSSLPQRTAPGAALANETKNRQTMRASSVLRMCSPGGANSNKRGYIDEREFGNASALLSETERSLISLMIRWRDGSERTNVKDELPALLFGELLFKRGHGFSAFANLVENLAVRN